MSKQSDIREYIEAILERSDAQRHEEATARSILAYLHSQGVVILAPDVSIERCSFVEPLIKEE